jgi:hypothetical protein
MNDQMVEPSAQATALFLDSNTPASAEDNSCLLEAVLGAKPPKVRKPDKIEGGVVGLLVGFEETGLPLVDFPANPALAPVPARSLVPLADGEAGREIFLLFEQGETEKPVVVGVVQPPRPKHTEGPRSAEAAPLPAVDAEVDGERLVLTAANEIVLRCGEASITLTRAGKVIIRGNYLLSRSAGVNKIQGGSIQLN